jgi:formylglycine-generating enzyme
MIRQAITIFAVLLALAVCGQAKAGVINISLVTVGDPSNPPDPLTGLGSVPYIYNISAFDTTMAQYCAFLNAVANTGDPYGLYNSAMAPGYPGLPTYGITQASTSRGYTYSVYGNGNVPAVGVNWGDAARFVNWLQNGQPVGPEGPGTTETGTYALNGGTSNAALMAVTRSTTATWVLPNSSEWYKSAYYAGGITYYQYATQSDSTPSNALSSTGTNNANFIGGVVAPPTFGYTDYTNYVTQVGAFAASPSHYGTYDQTGDVSQWNETANGTIERGLRGGSYDVGATLAVSTVYEDTSPAGRFRDVGFRVANVPEPGPFALLVAGAPLLLLRIRRALDCRGRDRLMRLTGPKTSLF